MKYKVNSPAIQILKALLLAALVITLDQASKSMILQFVKHTYERHEVTPFLNIIHAQNYGVAFGFLNGLHSKPFVPILIAILTLSVLWGWMLSQTPKNYYLPLGLITGGAFGNILDRVYHGAVIDFIDFHAFGMHYPAFNIADSFICIGAFILILI
jgi:signal peptidase II